MEGRASGRIYDALFSTPDMTTVFSDTELLRCMIRFEAALGRALEQAGIAPVGTAAAIAVVQPDDLDVTKISIDARPPGNLCIPVVKALTSAVEKANPAAAAYVHWGATSQDVQDTAMVLQAKAAWAILGQQVDALCAALVPLAVQHRQTVMAGRTWLQQGPPVTLGLKIAGWLDALLRHRERMQETRGRAFALQFGGAVGTLAALGDGAPFIAEKLAAELGLELPKLPWHTHRDRMAEMAATLGQLAGTLGKIGRDVSLLMQTEVGECMENAGSGGSSTMPHKRNPVSAAIMLSAAVRVPPLVATMLSAMVQEHERGLGVWHAEWETLPEIFRLTAGSLNAAISIAHALRADESAMAKNLEILHGAAMSEALAFALAAKAGKQNAHAIVEEITRRALDSGRSLLKTACADERVSEIFSAAELERILRPETYLGCSARWVDNVLRMVGGGDAKG